jgi:hypothetical protein
MGMNTKIKWNDGEAYELAITQWLVKTLHENRIKETHFGRQAGLGKSETDARTFRKLKEGKRHWSMVDLCKLAGFFGLKPSEVLNQVESFYEKEGVVIPGRTVERVIELGFSQEKHLPILISTWRKKGKSFFFLDCDPDWKKVAAGVIPRIIGMSSKQIFPRYPEVTISFENAWNRKGEDRIEIEYTTKIKTARKDSNPDEDRLLRVNSKFVPPDFIVVYVDDITDVVDRTQTESRN